jgi:mannose-6-phosphate isomerase-like protein (cupin superfamily)
MRSLARVVVSRSLLALLPVAALLAAAVSAGDEKQPAAQPSAAAAAPAALRVQSYDTVAEEKTAWGTLRWLMNAKLDPAAGLTLGDVRTEPGKSNPLHVHGNCEEVIYIISGSCEHRVGKQTVILKAGDALRIPAGVPHAAKALGKEPLRAIVVYNTGERQFTPVEEKIDKGAKP